MSVCKKKPAILFPLGAFGLEPVDQASFAMSRGGLGRHRGGSGTAPPSRQDSIGLGIASSGFGKPGSTNPSSMGNLGTIGASKLSSEDPNRAVSASGAPGQRTQIRGGGEQFELDKVWGGYNSYQNQQMQNLEPVAPLQASENRWDRKSIQVDQDSPELVDRKVKGLLNKLTMQEFDSISDQIIAWANKSAQEQDARTLIRVTRVVFEQAKDDAARSEMYARLCRKMMEQISSKVQDDGIKNNEGKPIAGGQLSRKYLINWCQEDFERGWMAKEATAAAAAAKSMEDGAAKIANEKTKEAGAEEVVLYSEEYYAAQRAKRQGLGLIKFIGELFKLQMLTERIMHECVKKLLGNVNNPEEEEIESLCKLLATVGGLLDTAKARAYLGLYFSRMKELTKSPNVNSRLQFMLQDLLELRERKWQPRNAVAAPQTIAQVYENAEKEFYQRQISMLMSPGGSRRGRRTRW
ncbi:armadillo-type protein [Crassisporium funariophilum]|nr:armadillo-type protein [Crassisporium funariophilum]